MKIDSAWKFDDLDGGLNLSIIEGIAWNLLRIENKRADVIRDFRFAKDGKFMGADSPVRAAEPSRAT
jgi:hypothetical protein